MLVKARNLRLGMLVDLEADQYADPARDHPQFRFELQEVGHVELETPTCVAIGFEGWDLCGFPPDHRLNVRRILRGD